MRRKRICLLVLLVTLGALYATALRGITKNIVGAPASLSEARLSALPRAGGATVDRQGLREAGRSSRSPSAALLADLIREDRYCAEKTFPLSEGSPEGMSEGKLEATPDRTSRSLLLYVALGIAAGRDGPDPCVQAMLSSDRAEALAFAAKSDAFACRFLRGLQLTGQWEPSGPVSEQGKQEGLAILRSLAEQDADNGLLAFFELGALTGSDESDRERAYLAMLRASRFEDPLRPLLREIALLGHQNLTAHLNGVEILSTVGVPRYTPGARAARALAAEGRYPEAFAEWSARLAEIFAEGDRRGLTVPNVSPLQNAVARSVVMAGRDFLPELPPILESENWSAYYRRRLPTGHLEADPRVPCEDFFARAHVAYPAWRAEFFRQLNF